MSTTFTTYTHETFDLSHNGQDYDNLELPFSFGQATPDILVKATDDNLKIAFIAYDDLPENPREWDNLGRMICPHRRYNLGDEPERPIEEHLGTLKTFIETRNGQDIIALPVYLYDHGGLTVSTRSFYGRAQHANWDSGLVGYIYVTHDRTKQEFGWQRLTKKRVERIKTYLDGEVETYNQFLTGDVFFITILTYNTKNGDTWALDENYETCGGFFGKAAAIEEAKNWLEV